MTEKKFSKVAAGPHSDPDIFKRQTALYEREGDIRSPFARDYTRILHSSAYRRLKHKTQVFFNAENDHVCTRIEHVAHVESVAYTMAVNLGLNEELTKAIAFGHDLGHAPFGHYGEKVLSALSLRYAGQSFWHERQGLRIVDKLDLLEDNDGIMRNLDLTYAVRDGIISHCGEVDENALRPRGECIDLEDIQFVGQYAPFTWEGCVVKLADKVAYLGRDVEDAVNLGFLDEGKLAEFKRLFTGGGDAVNTTVIMHDIIVDVCRHSSPEEGIVISPEYYKKLSAVKAFNYENIYTNARFSAFQKYASLIIETLFEGLYSLWRDGQTFGELERYAKIYPELGSAFTTWLLKYCDADVLPVGRRADMARYKNVKPYGRLENKGTYAFAITDFIAGMTDAYAIRLFGEQLRF